MAEVIEEQQQETQTPVVVVKKSRAGTWMGFIAIVMVIGLAAAGFYVVQQMQATQNSDDDQEEQRLTQVSQQINGLQAQLATLQSEVANVNAEMTGKDNHFTQTLGDFSKLHEEHLTTLRKDMESSISALQRQLGKTRGDWMLADAEYLLSVANQRLQLVGDVATARQALEAADERLRESGDAGVYKVREQITKEIALLNDVQVVDIVGIYAGIQHLQDAVEGLATFLPYAGKQPEKMESAGEELSKHGHEILGAIADQVSGYVTLRYNEQPMDAILTPEEAHFLKQQMKVRLEMVEIALIQENDTLFTTSIADAKQWLAKNFADNQQTQHFAGELDKLATIKLRNIYPDISHSLKLLRDISKLRLDSDKPAEKHESAPAPAAAEQQ